MTFRKPSFTPWLAVLAVMGLSIGIGIGTADRVALADDYGDAPSGTDNEAVGLPEASAFTLTDTNGIEHSLADFRGKHVVLEWINDGCPFVKKFYVPGKMQELQETYTEQDVIWLAIASSAPGKQGHHDAAGWNQIIADWDIKATAILLDEDGAVGRAYDAKTTPHMIVINPDGKLIYDGAIDSVRSASSDDIDDAENYVATVLDGVLLQKTQPYGCSVKYAN